MEIYVLVIIINTMHEATLNIIFHTTIAYTIKFIFYLREHTLYYDLPVIFYYKKITERHAQPSWKWSRTLNIEHSVYILF